jgi:HK97 gp10 family phage protein
MIECKMTWEGDKALVALKGVAWERLQRIAVFFWQAVVLALNVSNPRVPKKRTRNTSGGPKGSVYATYPTPSLPDEPPRKRTGWLQRNVLYELDKEKMEAKAGITVNALYGAFLELGTRKMAARPFLKSTLEKTMPQLKAIAGEEV